MRFPELLFHRKYEKVSGYFRLFFQFVLSRTEYSWATAFYATIFRAAGHQVAWEIVQRLNSRISRLRALTLASTNRRVSGPARMARICAAICANDPDEAARAVRDHLQEAAEIARHVLEGQP